MMMNNFPLRTDKPPY